ncbi:isoprenyl transferase [Lysinibacter sp. HNR]|uniref:isoprenyl transferase n=1 Tax=Lysinibacter sp. HNR TaxID=3031408 RepID=UPI002435D6F3|nr:isoprenyl transferase [Lysinibacter sp. HNR]WGD36847.1 isoprenyl transferase [Lysinibacter sp. HNR]
MTNQDSRGGVKFLYRLYEHRLRREIDAAQMPHHVAIIVDGNRRWAKQRLLESAAQGHRAGARKIPEFLGWCEQRGISVVTLYLLSTDNLTGRQGSELDELCDIIATLAEDLSSHGGWRVRHVGTCEGLPSELADALRTAEKKTAHNTGMHVNLAVGYGGRSEIAAAVRSIIDQHQAAGRGLDELADTLTPELIEEHLYTRGQADPDLVIRTSGEQRISDFMLWQSAYSEFYFVEALYPDLREVDFLRALRDYSRRQRRYGE